MRRALGIGLALALAVAGCGGSEREAGSSQATPDPKLTTPGTGTLPRPKAPPKQEIAPDVRDALDAGRIAVVDIAGKVGYEPRTLEIAQDAVVRGLKWSRWGAAGATGAGTLTYNSCNPTCASGTRKERPATVELTAPASCPDGRFFTASKVTPDSGPAPASYVQSPC